MMKTIAVTGSSGFIGKHLVNALRGMQYNILELDFNNGINLLLNDDIEKIPKFDTIIHLAGLSFVPQSFADPYSFYFSNYATTLNVLELAKKYNANVIFFSTYLYGNPKYLPIDEKHPLSPLNPYSESKLICEKLCEGYYRDFNVPITIFRPFNIYGPGQSKNFIIPSIIEQAKKDVILLKDPRPRRDFIYIDDVISAVLKAVDNNSKFYNIFNLGSGSSYAITEVLELIVGFTKSKAKVEFSNETRPGEILNTVADISLCKGELNWDVKISFSKGIEKMINQTV